jgi:hypothetical protein
MKILKTVLIGAALLASSSAMAGRTSQSFGVRLVVEDACRVDAARFAPERVAAHRIAAPMAAEGVEVNCKGASPYALGMAVGAVPMPSVAPAADDVRTLVVSY